MTQYPWMKSRFQDRDERCSICGRVIPANTPRLYNHKTGECAHEECRGIAEMRDVGTFTPANAEYAQGLHARISPPQETVEDRIERMRGEKMRLLERIAKALEGAK